MACVLDTSALIAFLKQETGWQEVAGYLAQDTYFSEINRAEFYTFMVRQGQVVSSAREVILRTELIPVDFNEEQATRAAELYLATMQCGLSLGDRACLALAQLRSLPVITADKVWGSLEVGVEVRVIR